MPDLLFDDWRRQLAFRSVTKTRSVFWLPYLNYTGCTLCTCLTQIVSTCLYVSAGYHAVLSYTSWHIPQVTEFSYKRVRSIVIFRVLSYV